MKPKSSPLFLPFIINCVIISWLPYYKDFFYWWNNKDSHKSNMTSTSKAPNKKCSPSSTLWLGHSIPSSNTWSQRAPPSHPRTNHSKYHTNPKTFRTSTNKNKTLFIKAVYFQLNLTTSIQLSNPSTIVLYGKISITSWRCDLKSRDSRTSKKKRKKRRR